jgi:RNA polymerase sigma-70 factor, ECF subfamily
MSISITPLLATSIQMAPLAGFSAGADERADLRLATDEVLVSRTRAGDVEAFGQLLGRHEGTVYRLACRLVRDERDAQEILQDVFVTTWTKLSGFEDRAQIGSWLHRVTVNTSLMRLRAQRRRPQLADIDGSALDATSAAPAVLQNPRLRPDEQLESQELKHTIQRAVDALPAGLRAVFDLREIQGLSTRQTARTLGISEGAVKARFHRARRVLRTRIGTYLVQ